MMIEIGKWQTLKCIRSKDFGVYLGDDDSDETVLLPRAQVPEDLKAGRSVDVFVYRDSEDRLIATVNMPLITLGEIVPLKCVSVTDIGAFMDWGLERDIFLPFKEQTTRVKEGKEYLVRLYEDKTGRLCVSMRLYGFLLQDSGYEVGEEVDGMVYELSDDWGAFVAVENTYSALIPKHELSGKVIPGDRVKARVSKVHPDGRLELSLRKVAHLQMEDDEEMLLKLIESYDGVLPFTEKASPEVIMRETGLSKAAFKRAVGGLYKKRKITLEGGKIRKI